MVKDVRERETEDEVFFNRFDMEGFILSSTATSKILGLISTSPQKILTYTNTIFHLYLFLHQHVNGKLSEITK